jgi:hypothetical protein
MKKALFGLIILAAASNCSWASEGYNTQKGALIGAVGGALAGQAIGRNTAGTLVGAAGGALVGAVAGNAVDQNQARERLAQAPGPVNAPAPSAEEAPPGEWVEVPGTWVNGQWVPAHRTWVPVDPNGGLVGSAPQSAPPPPVAANPPPPPAYAIPAPPQVAPIPGTYVYFVPGIGADILFYRGYWYRPHAGHWYRAASYNGPWVYTVPRMVPGPVIGLPPDFRRRVPPGFRPVRHAEMVRNWERWERERYWDHHRGRR